MYICVTHVFSAQRDQKRVSHPPEVELQTVVSCLIWVLGSEPRSFAKISQYSYSLSHLFNPLSTFFSSFFFQFWKPLIGALFYSFTQAFFKQGPEFPRIAYNLLCSLLASCTPDTHVSAFQVLWLQA